MLSWQISVTNVSSYSIAAADCHEDNIYLGYAYCIRLESHLVLDLLRCACAWQVIYSCSCQLVLPKHAVTGTMRLTALHVHFIGEVQQPPDECGARSGHTASSSLSVTKS